MDDCGKSIVAKSKINKGEIFNENNIISKRPEGGIPAIFWPKIIGKNTLKPKKMVSIGILLIWVSLEKQKKN